MIVNLIIDIYNQWFVSLWILKDGIKVPVKFKIDTGCNAVILSHSTLKSMGFFTDKTKLSKLPSLSGLLASGDKHVFRQLGIISLYKDYNQTMPICDTEAICHSTQETHDLLGTEIFRKFKSVLFNTSENKYMELR